MRTGAIPLIILSFFLVAVLTAAQTDSLIANYWKAVGLMDLGMKSRVEGRDDAAWGEYVRAYHLLSYIKEREPDFTVSAVGSKLRSCKVAIKHLSSALPEGERRMYSRSGEALKKFGIVTDQKEEILDIVHEIKDFLGVAKKKTEEPPKKEVVVAWEKADDDADGLPNKQEVALGTNPYSSDTDGDGLGDFEEVNTYGTSPVLADTDRDGLSDAFELLDFGTLPLNPDTDNDGLTDEQEIMWGTDPNNPDTDDDSYTDGDEVSAGYDPLVHLDESWE